MKKLTALASIILIITALFSGCSENNDFTVDIIKNGEIVLHAQDTETVKAYKDGSNTLFKDVSLNESGGLFYNSTTFKAATNIMESKDKYELKVTMPGKIVQSTGGTTDGNTITYVLNDFTSENDIAAYADSNNTAAVIIIVCVLVILLAGFLFFMKEKQG